MGSVNLGNFTLSRSSRKDEALSIWTLLMGACIGVAGVLLVKKTKGENVPYFWPAIGLCVVACLYIVAMHG
jgi:hypothetical protein